MFGKRLPEVGRRGFCIFRDHKRKDKSLTIFKSDGGDLLYKCFSCDGPDNVGDALAMYAQLEGLDRKTAWHQLRERGYSVPGAQEGGAPQRRRPPPPKKRPVPVTGRAPVGGVLSLSPERWQQWQQQRLGAVESLAASRHIGVELLRDHDVVDVDRAVVGFGYREPFGGQPCRVKCRPLDRKTFWIEPRPAKGQEGKALGPLYLADRLNNVPGHPTVAIVTEGELDALTFIQAGLSNVVSLPDGAQSAARVDLQPLSSGFLVWLVATDRDGEGQQAFVALRSRARSLGATAVRLLLGQGDRQFKDANEALQSGFEPADFIRSVNRAAAKALGYNLQVA
ncbi:MAG: toprim domain-containing protein [Deltaproteobacteria bacterium]|nr:toprim domain-containing protein [Deltaproteobacteria bacterium]